MHELLGLERFTLVLQYTVISSIDLPVDGPCCKCLAYLRQSAPVLPPGGVLGGKQGPPHILRVGNKKKHVSEGNSVVLIG